MKDDKPVIEIIREKLGGLAGAASLCWIPRPEGVFDSTQASKFVDETTLEMEKLYVSPPYSCAWCRQEFPQREEHLAELRDHILTCRSSPLASALRLVSIHDSLHDLIEETLKLIDDNSTMQEARATMQEARAAIQDVFAAIDELRQARAKAKEEVEKEWEEHDANQVPR